MTGRIWPIRLATAAIFVIVALAPLRVIAQQGEGADRDESRAAGVPAGPIPISRVAHVNSGLVLFDDHDRQYVLPDGRYTSDEEVVLEISSGRIQRMIGCGEGGCDFTTHSTRVVDRQLLLYAEIRVPDGTYRHESGVWFAITGGELMEFELRGGEGGSSEN